MTVMRGLPPCRRSLGVSAISRLNSEELISSTGKVIKINGGLNRYNV